MKDESVTTWRRSSVRRWRPAHPRKRQNLCPDPAQRFRRSGPSSFRANHSAPQWPRPWFAPGTRAVSVFLVNNRNPLLGVRRDEAYVFQVTLQLEFRSSLCCPPRPSRSHFIRSDERVADLQYRDASSTQWAIGVSARALLAKSGDCRVRRNGMDFREPKVERIRAPNTARVADLEMEKLAI